MTISTDAQIDVLMRAQAMLTEQLRTEGVMGENDALHVWHDSQEAFIEGAKSTGEEWVDYWDRYLACEDIAAQQIEDETRESVPFGDGAHASFWQGRDGWYWTVISPDGVNYDDDHGPFESKADVLDDITYCAEHAND